MLDNYKRGLEWLNEHRPYFAVLVTNLGTPMDDRSIDTACVRLRHGATIFEFAVNETFLEPLSDEEVAGVLAHEAFHILLDHFDTHDDPHLEDEKKRVLATECICNDNVLDEGIKLPDMRRINPKTGKLTGGPYYGYQVVGQPVGSYTVREVYDLMTDEQADDAMPDMDEEASGHTEGISAEQAEQIKQKMKQGIQDARSKGQLSDDDQPSTEAVKDAMDEDEGQAQKAGTEGKDGVHALKEAGVSMEWAKLIRQLDPTAFDIGGELGKVKYSWHQPRRKIAHMDRQGVRLPSYRPKHDPQNLNGGMKPTIILALDFSGSIPQRMLDIMSNLAFTVPKTIDVHCCTFSTYYHTYDPKLRGNQTVAMGGTDFDAISEFVDSLKLKQYPTVVAITDGYANFHYRRPKQEQLDKKWNWLLIDRHNRVGDQNVRPETVKFLADYANI